MLGPISGYKLQSRSASVTESTPGSFEINFEGPPVKVAGARKAAELPTVRLLPSRPWDWHRAGAVAIDVSNTGSRELELGLRVDDSPRANGVEYSQSGTLIIPAKSSLTCIFSRENADPMHYGMRAFPPVIGQTKSDRALKTVTLKGDSQLDFSKVLDLCFFLRHPAHPTAVQILRPRLLAPLQLSKIVDAYGQFSGPNWPGKLQSAEQLRARRDGEQAQLKGRSSDLDAFGGWMGGPNLEAGRFFRTQKIHGKWWLITPDGHLFFSLGIDGVNAPQPTVVSLREWMFGWLPGIGEPLSDCYGRNASHRTTFDFHQANLERKFGSSWQQARSEQAISRLLAWGFNTLGNASAENLHKNGRVAYVVTARYPDRHAHIGPGREALPDPFDPVFAKDLERGLKPQAAKVTGDPYCLGWFVDDRLNWGNDRENQVVRAALRVDARRSPAKRALLARLQKSYAAVADLNATWNTHFAHWEQLGPPCEVGASLTAGQRSDFSGFLGALARQYFQVVRQTVRHADPNHLYLGCRFASSPSEALDAAAEFCDALSFCASGSNLNAERWAYLKNIGKPCIVGALTGALDHAVFATGQMGVPNQRARAVYLKDCLTIAFEQPALVGCHCFEYSDEPLLGRESDGDNSNLGFVDVTDTPYPELVEAARETAAEMYPHRYALISE